MNFKQRNFCLVGDIKIVDKFSEIFDKKITVNDGYWDKFRPIKV